MLKKIIWKNMTESDRKQCLERANIIQQKSIEGQVLEIIDKVKAGGDAVLQDLTAKFDGVVLKDFLVSEQEKTLAIQQLDSKRKSAILRAKQQIMRFHDLQKPSDYAIETSPGVVCEKIYRPINRVGFYIPAGSAPLVSSVLMMGVPASIAKCSLRVMCTPPRSDGSIEPAILFAAQACQIDFIFKVGGAQAIAAMAYGTESIPKVDKIFGPGNRWVTQAKICVGQDSQGALCDLPAGPSEVMVLADKNANPDFIAADLLGQAEHGADSQVILITTENAQAEAVMVAITNQMNGLSRKTIIQNVLQNSYAIVVENMTTALEIINAYAPEHLILQCDAPRQYIKHIQCAGSVFIGPWSPVTAGDYASGTNHVLPTDGYARAASGLSVMDFMKSMSVQTLTKSGLQDLSDTLIQLAGIEGLDAHQNAVKVRLETVK